MKYSTIATILLLIPQLFFAAERAVPKNLKKALEEGTKYLSEIVEKKKIDKKLPYVDSLRLEIQRAEYYDKEDFRQLLKGAYFEVDPEEYIYSAGCVPPLYRILWKLKGRGGNHEFVRPICGLAANCGVYEALRSIKESIKLKFCKNELGASTINHFGTHIVNSAKYTTDVALDGKIVHKKWEEESQSWRLQYNAYLQRSDPRTALYIKDDTITYPMRRTLNIYCGD